MTSVTPWNMTNVYKTITNTCQTKDRRWLHHVTLVDKEAVQRRNFIIPCHPVSSLQKMYGEWEDKKDKETGVLINEIFNKY